MVYAKKGNRVHPIAEVETDNYLNRGYDIIDDKGALVKECIPNNVGALQNSFKKHVAQIAELQAKVDELTAENAKLKSAKAERKPKTTKDITEPVAETVAE